jgi:hypothetical protein
MDRTPHTQPSAHDRPPRRRARQPVKRPRTIRFALTDEEFSQVAAAADRAGLAKGAFAAQATLIIARNGTTPSDSPLREALGEFIRAAGLVRRIGVNLNQAVAKLNATGQRSGDLVPYAAESLRRAQLLDRAAEEIRKRIRQ